VHPPKTLQAFKLLWQLTAAGQSGDLTDELLLERFRLAGEEAAFAILVQRHGPMVLGACRRVLGDGPDAEDAFQAAFLALARQARGARRLACVGGWLYRVARNLAAKARTAAARRRHHERHCPCPQKALPMQPERQETRELLEEELGRLPEKYRAPVVLCCLEGNTHEEAARALGCPKSSLTSRLARARELLRGRLTRRGVTLPAGMICALLLEETAAAGVRAALVLQAVRLAVGAVAVPAHLAELARGAPPGGTAGKWLIGFALAAGLAVGPILLAASPAAEAPEPSQAGAPQGQAPPPAAGKEMPRPATDLHGDPLPAGAVARFGTLRLYLRHGIYGLASSPDGKLLASTGDSEGVILWEATSGKEVRRLSGSYRGYRSVRFTRGGKDVVAVYGGILERWDAATGKHLGRSAEGEYRLAVTPDGQTLATVGAAGLAVHDPASLRVLRRIKAPGVFKDAPLALSPDGKTLAAMVGYTQIAFWDVASGKAVGVPIKSANPVLALEFAPDGRTLAAGMAGGAVQAWDVKTGQQRYRRDGHKGHVNDLAFAPGGQVFATGGEDRTVRVWDAASGEELACCTGHVGGVHAVAFAPTSLPAEPGRQGGNATRWLLASGGTDRCVRWWGPATWKERAARGGHVYGARAAAFLPDARTVVSAGPEEGIRLWRALSGEGLGLLTVVPADGHAAFALRADGRVAAVLRRGERADIGDVLKLSGPFQN
jgi:RNA polymerase sigma factor (sigma-70 family)